MMACLEGTSKAKFSSKALKKLDDVLRRMRESLVDIAEAENLFKHEVDAATNRGPNILSQLETLPERANHLALYIPTLVNHVKRQVQGIVDFQETLTTCDAIFRVVCAIHGASEEVAMASMQQLQLRLGAASTASTSYAPKTNVDVAEASNRVAGAQAVKQSRTITGNTCRHFCEHHQEVMNNALWRNLPKELLERICAFLKFSKTIVFTKSYNSRSELPMITAGFRQFCAEAHRDLFGLVMYHEDSQSYRLAVSNSQHEEWFHMELSIPFDYGKDLVFGHDGGLISILPRFSIYFEESEEPPSILVYNPLTGDQNNIQLSNSTSITWVEAFLLQLIMDEETRCYKLNLVTRSGSAKTGGTRVFHSETYDSKSGLWSTLDSSVLHGDGVGGHSRSLVYMNCTSERLSDGLLVMEPIYQLLDFRSSAFVRDHFFKMEFIDVEGDDRMYHLLQISESVWQKDSKITYWKKSSTTTYDMEEPPESFETRLLACQRYLLVVADDASSNLLEHRHQRMVLFDRQTGEKAYDIPQFLTQDFVDDTNFMRRNLHLMCDLKWDAIP